ncbi:hypothetical protein LAV79_15285 [Peribacillus butanolivorans]|uniref:hypothetical protein n=1 Tax=Peribacillus butanolivorans TaxID=421767 RepID=UPI0030C968EE
MFPSFKYELAYKGNRYSPVDVIKIASKEANGVEFSTLSGGNQTNNVLIDLGFTVVLKGTNQVIGKNHSDSKRKLFKKSVSLELYNFKRSKLVR